jgi:8-oxo-dGTP pyrophosphatase MutT (NUDIX family)
MRGMGEQLVTTGAAAKAIGVTPVTLQRWAHAGIVTPATVTAGGHMRWDLDDLREQLNRRPGGTGTRSPSEPEPQPVAAAIVTSDRGVLVGRRNDRTPPWTFIAGEIEPGESPADAAAREVKEETGLLVHIGREIGRRIHPATGRLMIYLTAEPENDTGIFVGDRAELAEVRWVDLDQAEALLPGMYEPVRTHLVRALARSRRSA